MSASPFSFAIRVLGSAALVLIAALVIGFFLPADWEASASATVPGSAEEVFELLDAPEGWRMWTTWPESGLVREGPERGAGAAMSWDDPEVGQGRFAIAETVPARSVRYEVEVGNGAMRTEGQLTLAADGAERVRVTWRERGDLGRNPLMGYWALFMNEAQTTELEKGLERLGAAVSP